MLVNTQPRVMITYKLEKIHQVVRFQLVRISLVGAVYSHQWIGQHSEDVTSLEFGICVPELRQHKSLIYRKIEVVVVILAVQQSLNSGDVPELYNGILVDNRCPESFSL